MYQIEHIVITHFLLLTGISRLSFERACEEGYVWRNDDIENNGDDDDDADGGDVYCICLCVNECVSFIFFFRYLDEFARCCVNIHCHNG